MIGTSRLVSYFSQVEKRYCHLAFNRLLKNSPGEDTGPT